MSGTIARERRRSATHTANMARLRAKAKKQQSIQLNREAVIAEVCATFGWKELDPFAKDMLDKAFAGKAVDVKKLKKDLADWKSAQSGDVRTEETANVDQLV